MLGATRTGVFGGFNPNGWMSTDDYYGSMNAFLFVQKGGGWIKLRKIGGGEAAIFDYARSGPQFGPGELVIGATQALTNPNPNHNPNPSPTLTLTLTRP